MILERVAIKNFRSIRDVEIDFDPPCRVLVGINESGKTNILKALAFLSDGFNPETSVDLREALPEEDRIEESHIRFIFKFQKEDSDSLFDQLAAQILSGEDNPVVISHGKKHFSLKEFCNEHTGGVFNVDILTEKKTCRYFSMEGKAALKTCWKKPTVACPADFSITVNGNAYKPTQFKMLNITHCKDTPETYFENATREDLSTVIGGIIVRMIKERLPKTLLWKYDEKHLLPSSVDIAGFSDNPETCLPLKNMFALANIDNIKEDIENASNGSSNRFQNFLNNIANKTTSHFRSVWKEYKNVEFSLVANADNIVPGIKEKNTHDFSRRSDGFKRFITFLLMISVNVKMDNLRDTLLLIDEPDESLHPSGARYLKDELIRISKTNYVLYSTHSIFMIDSGDIGRHYVVKKEDEITRIEPAQESNICDEEVLYNALGYSVYSTLKKKNIIFEGWNDKRLFQVALKRGASELRRKYAGVGICHARGAPSIKAITPLIELAKRECIIVSDDDRVARDHKKLYEQENGFGKWNTYRDIDSTIEAVTGEDFLKKEFIVQRVNAVVSSQGMSDFQLADLPDDNNKLRTVSAWLVKNGMTVDQAKNSLKEIKRSIFESLKSEHIEDAYEKLLKKVRL